MNAERWSEEVRRRALRMARIATSREAQRLDFEACRRDFFFWLENYGWLYNPHETESPARRAVPFVPWDSQRELMAWLLERLDRGEEALVPKSRKIGVTWLVLHHLWWRHRFERGFSALLGSRKEELVDRRGDMDTLFERLRYITRMQPVWIRPGPEHIDKDRLMALPSMETELAGESTNDGFGQGKRRTIVFIDEAGKVDSRIAGLTWTSVESVARSLWVVFNPPPLSSHFIWQVRTSVDPSKVFPMTWRADPERPEDFRERSIRPHGRLTPEEFAEQYECQAGAVMPGRIWPISVRELLYDEDHPKLAELRRTCWLYGGMDFGSGIASRLVCLLGLVELSTPWRLWIENDLSWSQTTWVTAGADIMAAMDQYPMIGSVFYDPAGHQRDSNATSWVKNLGGTVNFRHLTKKDGLPYGLNTTGWVQWSIRQVRFFLDSGQIRVHRRCRYLRESIEGYRYPHPPGASSLDAGSAARSPVKDDASHGADALRHLATGVWWLVEAMRAAGREAPMDYGAIDPDAAVSAMLDDGPLAW